jgi:hypothetical protein
MQFAFHDAQAIDFYRTFIQESLAKKHYVKQFDIVFLAFGFLLPTVNRAAPARVLRVPVNQWHCLPA